MTQELEIISIIFKSLISEKKSDGIPVDLRAHDVVGTVQDDPFDCWVEMLLKGVLPERYEVFHSGKLTTPDIIIRDRKSGFVIGLEIKKLIQKSGGKDPRGLTMDYNSCLPCGRSMVKVGKDTVVVPCYYLFALLNSESTRILTLIVVDGDFFNYDYELHKEAKYSNYTEYNHGPYGEGSVRHRKMYTYPNPLNSRLKCFYLRQLLIVKKCLVENTRLDARVSEEIIRTDRYGNSFYYVSMDGSRRSNDRSDLTVLEDIFADCKVRLRKERVAYLPEIPSM